MRKFLANVLAALIGTLIGVFFLILIVTAIAGSIASGGKKKAVKVSKDSVLELHLDGEVLEREVDDPLRGLLSMDGDPNQNMGLDVILSGLQKAKKDDKIRGIFLRITRVKSGMATTESIRKALLDFKSSGKFIIAYSEELGEKTYYLASAADKVYLYPTGELEWNGLSATPMFVRGLLDKLEVKPMIFKVGQFKSAAESFTEKQMSEPNRRQIQTILDDLWGHMLDEIAASRKLDRNRLDQMASELTITDAKGAKKHGLVDDLKHPDEVEAELKRLLKREEKADLDAIDFFDYAEAKAKTPTSSKQVAVIYAVGGIDMGKGGVESIGSESLSEQIRKARNDDKIKAIVLRVNSPGGSALASDILAREIELTRKVKPVIASYGDVAASGGYYISALCDSIVAEATTITGSIGVIGMMYNTQQFFSNKLGITHDRVYSSSNQYADLGNPNRTMTAFEEAKIQRAVEDIYSDFIHVVRRGRNFPDSMAVDSIAQGRIWSGKRAVNLRLVDRIGSLGDAVAMAARKAALTEGDYEIITMPELKSFFERAIENFKSQARAYLLEDYLTKDQIAIINLARILNAPRGLYTREFLDLDFN
jgi:protease-4